MAIASGQAYQSQECFVGELEATGEIQAWVSNNASINWKIGFTKVMYRNSLVGITPPKEIEVIGVTTIQFEKGLCIIRDKSS